MMKGIFILLLIVLVMGCNNEKPAVVFITDFGLKDGAVSAMKGVAISVDPRLNLFDLTHEIPPYNIWEAAYRLEQTARYWPEGTIFVSVVDPGVGTARKSVVMLSRTGHYFVTPDNGTLTLVSRSLGIREVREINEAVNRRRNSDSSYTFHGRDVYAFTAARLAAGRISFEEVGDLLPYTVVTIPFEEARLESDSIAGGVPILDVEYGNVWTNIPDSLVRRLGVRKESRLTIRIKESNQVLFEGEIPFANTFGEVPVDSTLAYLNSLRQLSFGINQGNFSDRYKIKSGPDWKITVKCIAGCK